jgi:hypothetical protein
MGGTREHALGARARTNAHAGGHKEEAGQTEQHAAASRNTTASLSMRTPSPLRSRVDGWCAEAVDNHRAFY